MIKPVQVTEEFIPEFWEYAGDFLQDAIALGNGAYDLNDLLYAIQDKDMQLWAAIDEDTMDLYGLAITELRVYPQKTIACVIALGGKDFKLWRECVLALEEWAEENGAVGIEFITRPGIVKEMKSFGYSPVGIHTYKDLVSVVH